MLRIWVVLFWLLCLVPVGVAGIPLKDSALIAKADAALTNLKMYGFGYEVGEEYGRNYFELYYLEDCTFLTVQSPAVGSLMNYFKGLMTRNEPVSMYNIGLRAGWVTGFYQAFRGAYAGCEAELDDIVRIAYRERIKTCQLLASDLAEDLRFEDTFKDLPAKTITPREARKLLGMVYLGSSSEAWEQIKSVDSQTVSALPCAAVLIKSLQDIMAQEVKENNISGL